MAIAGTAKIMAKKSATPDFLLCRAGLEPASTNSALYPAAFIFFNISVFLTSGGAKMCTVSVAKLTLALTPSISFKVFSIVFTQEEQVIPETEKVRGSMAI